MRTGRKNRLITIQQPVTTASNTGSRSVAWETFIEVWGYLEDRVRGAKEDTASSVLYPMHNVDWIIRYTAGITPAMRVSYDGQVWEIIGVLNVDNRRAEMRLACELRGNGAATSGLTCLPATYRNGSSPTFEQQIASGAVYTAPAITVTDVNGTTRSVLPNINITAIWSAITGRNTDGVQFFALAAYPSGGAVVLEDIEVEDTADIIGSFPQPTRIVVVGSVDGVEVDKNTGEMTITVDGEVCEPATYSNGGAFSQQIASGATYTAPQIVVTDVNGTTRNVLPNIAVTCAWSAITVRSTDDVATVGVINSYPTDGKALIGTQRLRQPNNSVFTTAPFRTDIKLINADIQSVNQTPAFTEITVVLPACPTLTKLIEDATWSEIEGDLSPAQLAAAQAAICTPCPPAPTAIAPMFIPATQKTVYFTGKLDEGGRITAGDFALPSGAFAQQQSSDFAAANPFLTLLHNNEFGNKSAFCDTAGNPLDYSSSTPADNIVLHTGYRRMWYIVRTSATSVDNALDLAAAASHGGFTDWRIPTRAEIHTLFDYNNVNSLSTVLGKPPGFATTSVVNVTTCTTNSLSTSQIFITFSNGGRQTTPVAANTSKNFILVRTY
jgi:head-tail adaptor